MNGSATALVVFAASGGNPRASSEVISARNQRSQLFPQAEAGSLTSARSAVSPDWLACRRAGVVDQFEELFTQAAPAERARFTALLGPALAGPVQVVATLRPEFLDQLLADPDLAGLPTHVHALRPLRREALRAVVEGPARLAGIEVDEDLVALPTPTPTAVRRCRCWP